jgi:hypothetical protein
MFRYKLRTLLIALAIIPLLIWGGRLAYEAMVTEMVRALFPVEDLQLAEFLDGDNLNPTISAAGEDSQ